MVIIVCSCYLHLLVRYEVTTIVQEKVKVTAISCKITRKIFFSLWHGKLAQKVVVKKYIFILSLGYNGRMSQRGIGTVLKTEKANGFRAPKKRPTSVYGGECA